MARAQMQIVDTSGRPLASVEAPFNISGRSSAHDAASMASAELASWNPREYSADGALLPDLKRLRARNHDMIRNHGLMSGAVQIHLDNVIGSGLRLIAKPDWRYLGVTDKKYARDWERDVEVQFRNWANDVDQCIDASGRLNFASLLAQAYRSYLTSFEILASAEWVKRPGKKYRTAIQNIDPMRLSNPYTEPNTTKLRDGVEVDDLGAPVAYWISTKTDDFLYQTGLPSWKRYERYTSWGRKSIIHYFDNERAGQSRGTHGIVSVLAKLKMLEKFEQASLQAAILNAMYAAVIESSMDWQNVGNALGAGNAATDPVLSYMGNRAEFHKEGNVRYNGVKIPHLFPGEKFSMLAPQHPSANFASFEEATLRYVAAGANLTYEQLSRDYSKTNYSSARAGMLEAWRFFSGKQTYIAKPFATDIYALWLEEAIERGDVEIPGDAPDFYEAKTAWTRSDWIGPGRGHIDPEKESAATAKELALGLTTMERAAAERGEDWQDLLEQRVQEQELMRELGLDPADFQNAAMGVKGTAPTVDGEPGDAATGNDSQTSGAQDAKKRAPPAVPAEGTAARKDGPGVVVVPYDVQGEMQDLRREVREAIDTSARVVQSNADVAKELSKVSIPVYDSDGKLLYAKRVSQSEIEEQLEG